MAINDTFLLLDERNLLDTQFPDQIVRLELSKLDTLAAGLL